LNVSKKKFLKTCFFLVKNKNNKKKKVEKEKKYIYIIKKDFKIKLIIL